MKAIVLAEHEDAARELCAGARTMADEVLFVQLGDCPAPEAAADRILRVAVPEGEAVEDAAWTVCAVLDNEGAGVVLAEPTRRLKIVAGRLAAHAGTAALTDVMAFDAGVAESMYFGGVGVRKQKAEGLLVCTVSSGAFADLEASGAGAVEDVEWVSPAVAPVTVVSSRPVEKSGVDLTKAEVIVAAGRGFADAESLQGARDVAEKLGAGLGCTRPLAEGEDLFPREAYIGVSGVMCSPKVYLGAGLSGQMQHMVGVNRAQTIFAVNKDKNAPIFKQCDYGLVGDVNEVMPALAKAL